MFDHVFIEFQDGEAKKPLKEIGKSKESGTQITFLPSKKVFSSIKFSGNILIKRMRELAFLNKGIRINLTDKRHQDENGKDFFNSYFSEGGLKELVTSCNGSGFWQSSFDRCSCQ